MCTIYGFRPRNESRQVDILNFDLEVDLLSVYGYILWGRFINGIGCGVATTVGPMMLTEMCPVQFRGAFGSCNQLGLCAGMIFAWILSMPELSTDSNWVPESESLNPTAFILGMPIVIGIFQLCILPLCPDSPAYLAGKVNLILICY